MGWRCDVCFWGTIIIGSPPHRSNPSPVLYALSFLVFCVEPVTYKAVLTHTVIFIFYCFLTTWIALHNRATCTDCLCVCFNIKNL